jgi:hypothetical protein
MLKRLDRYFMKIDLIPESIVFQPKTFDAKVKIFVKIPFTLEKLSFWHYRILRKYFVEPFFPELIFPKYFVGTFCLSYNISEILNPVILALLRNFFNGNRMFEVFLTFKNCHNGNI